MSSMIYVRIWTHIANALNAQVFRKQYTTEEMFDSRSVQKLFVREPVLGNFRKVNA